MLKCFLIKQRTSILKVYVKSSHHFLPNMRSELGTICNLSYMFKSLPHHPGSSLSSEFIRVITKNIIYQLCSQTRQYWGGICVRWTWKVNSGTLEVHGTSMAMTHCVTEACGIKEHNSGSCTYLYLKNLPKLTICL